MSFVDQARRILQYNHGMLQERTLFQRIGNLKTNRKIAKVDPYRMQHSQKLFLIRSRDRSFNFKVVIIAAVLFSAGLLILDFL